MKFVWYFISFLIGVACFVLSVTDNILIKSVNTWVCLTVLFLGVIQVFLSVVGFFFSIFIYRDKKKKSKSR